MKRARSASADAEADQRQGEESPNSPPKAPSTPQRMVDASSDAVAEARDPDIIDEDDSEEKEALVTHHQQDLVQQPQHQQGLVHRPQHHQAGTAVQSRATDNGAQSGPSQIQQPPASSVPQTLPLLGGQFSMGGTRHNSARPDLPCSHRHQRLPANASLDPTPRTTGEGYDDCCNLLAIFGNDEEPRTMYPLRIERARNGNLGDARFPQAQTLIPARTSLREICARYPNHVWGSMLRIFRAEGWGSEKIWNALPSDVRHSVAQTRPWNYLQQATGREIDRMIVEETGARRTIAARVSPVSATPAPALRTERDLTIVDLQTMAVHERARILDGLSQVMPFPVPVAGVVPVGYAEAEFRRREARWAGGLRNVLQAVAPGFELRSRNPVDLLRTVWQVRHPAAANETLLEYQRRSSWHAWRNYCATLQRWSREWHLP